MIQLMPYIFLVLFGNSTGYSFTYTTKQTACIEIQKLKDDRFTVSDADFYQYKG